MNTLRFLAVLLCGALPVLAEDSPRKIAYEVDSKIFVTNLDGTGAKKVAKGVFPDISPDGARVAFNTEEQAGDKFVRHIAVVELADGKVTVFKDVPSENVYNPKWSPDGKELLFSMFDGKIWNLVRTNADGADLRVVKKGKESDPTMSSPCWAPDGKSFFAQDMKNIYRCNLDGSEIAHWEIQKSIPNGDMSGDGRVEVSPDGQSLLLGIDMNEEAHRKTWDGPLPALWTFNVETKKSLRLTTKKLFGWDGCWLDGATVLFLSQAANEKNASLYSMPVAGGTPKLIAKGGVRSPSVSR